MKCLQPDKLLPNFVNCAVSLIGSYEVMACDMIVHMCNL